MAPGQLHQYICSLVGNEQGLNISQVCGGEETGLFLEETQDFQGWRTDGFAEHIFYPCENRKTHKYTDKQEMQEMALDLMWGWALRDSEKPVTLELYQTAQSSKSKFWVWT